MLIRGLKSKAHNIGAYMNINKIVKDSVSIDISTIKLVNNINRLNDIR